MGIESKYGNGEYEAFRLMDDSRVYTYLTSIVKLPCTFDIREIESYDIGLGDTVTHRYQHCYYESTPTRPEDSDKGVEGFIIGYKDTNKRNDVIYILDIINGEFVKISSRGQEISHLTGSISDIGKGSKCGLLSDFMSYILLDQRIDKPEPRELPELINLMDTWFYKTTNDLCEEMDKLEVLNKNKGEIKVGTKEKVIVDLELLDPMVFQVPSKKHADMFKIEHVYINLKYRKLNEKFRMWTTDLFDESLGYDEESLFLAMGNILYVFNQIEELVWVHHLDQGVEGYETIPANRLVSKLYERFIKEVELFKSVSSKVDNQTDLETNRPIIKEIALLLIACTNTEIANENLSIPELIAVTSEILGYKFEYINPSIKG